MNARVPALVLIAVLVVGAIALDRSASEPLPDPFPVVGTIDGPTIPPEAAVSVAWFCAEGTSTIDGRATETIIVGNLASNPIDVTVTVMPGGDQRPVSERRQVDILGQARIEVADILETPEPGVVVEVSGGPAIVEHELRGRDDVAVGPCSRVASEEWYFAEGTTDRGAEEWLALFNPFGDDAIVDVSFLTDSGFQAPGPTQAFVVPRRSRVSLAVHDEIVRQERVAISVRARTGRVVAERSLLFDATDARYGLAVSLGVTGQAKRWRVVGGTAAAGTAQSVSVANFGERPTAVDVGVRLGGDEGVLEPESVEVPARGVVRVDLTDRVPADASFAVDVRVTRDAPVVVDAFGTWAAPSEVIGVATTPGSVTTSRRWAFTLGRADEDGDGVISAVNVSGQPVTVQLYVYTAGDPNSPTSAPGAEVAAGEQVDFRVGELGIGPDMVLVVLADGPIVAARRLEGGGVSTSPGIPARGG
jgi:hypothetical protein